MKKILFIIILCVGYLFLHSQESKLNQEKPLNKEAGRVAKLKKVMTITDEQGGFYFRMPRKMQISSDGSIYLMELNQMLRFDINGKLLNNYHRKGEGPGEFVMIKSFFVNVDKLIVFSSMPNKIMWFAKNGPLIKEFKIKRFSFGDLILFRNDKYYFVIHGIPRVKGEGKFVDIEYKILEFSNDGQKYKHLTSFPVKKYVIAEGNGRRAYRVGIFIAKTFKNRYLIISNTPEYLVKIYDIEKNLVINMFSRKYSRVIRSNKGQDKDKNRPKLKYENDIRNILTFKNMIWIVTSTQNKTKGRLVDVFAYEGNYLENFYLKLRGQILGNHENNIFVLEEDDTDNLVIIKYRITEF